MDKYERQITDSQTIRLIILFTINKANRILSNSELVLIILENCNINYFDLLNELFYLVDIDYIYKVQTDKGAFFEITQKGTYAIDSLYKIVPIYIREPIEKSINPILFREEQKRQITAEIMPLNEREFLVECKINDVGKPLMNLSIYGGNRKQAIEIAEKFKKDTDKIFSAILNILLEKEPKQEDCQDTQTKLEE